MTAATARIARWSTRDRVRATIVVSYLVLQVAVPAVMLFGSRPQRFSWHMFTTAPIVPSLVLYRLPGGRDTVDVNAYFAVRRPELTESDLARLPAHICRITPDVRRVELRLRRDAMPQVYSCP